MHGRPDRGGLLGAGRTRLRAARRCRRGAQRVAADGVAEAVPGNAVKQVVALALQKAGDLLVDAKTVLTWLLAALGAPAAITALLVPVRESGSMLPQAWLAPYARSQPVRKWLWVAGAVGQAGAVALMAIVVLTLRGAAPAGRSSVPSRCSPWRGPCPRSPPRTCSAARSRRVRAGR
jgi:hypothetical protein